MIRPHLVTLELEDLASNHTGESNTQMYVEALEKALIETKHTLVCVERDHRALCSMFRLYRNSIRHYLEGNHDT